MNPRGKQPYRLTLPNVGFSPTVPQNDAGMRIEPPVSLPIAQNTAPVATTTPLPPLATQQTIVSEIKSEQALVGGNCQLIERFEMKIEDTLGRVWGEDASREEA